MDSLLNPKEYEMVGNIEVRAEDWARLRKRERINFIKSFVSSSLATRIGAWVWFFAITDYLEVRLVRPFDWFLIFLGLYYIGASVLYSVRAWSRLEVRFATAIKEK